MSLNIWNLEWLNHNSQRSYPIADWANRECNLSSDIKLPNDFILALSLSVNSSHNIEIDKFYIKAIAVMDKCCSITIGYAEGELDVAEITIYTESLQDTYAFTGIDNFDDVKGYIGINKNSIIFAELSGYFTFDYESTAIEPDCIRNTSKMLSGIQIDTGNRKSNRMYGRRTFFSGDNFNIDAVTEGDTTTITFNAIDSSVKKQLNGEEEEEECMPNFAKKKPILSINGVKPDKDGNIEIEGLNSAVIRKVGNGIKVEDAFAEPCCQCDDLNALYDKLNELIAKYRPMQALASDIDTRQQILDEGGNTCNTGNSCNCIDEEYPEPEEPTSPGDPAPNNIEGDLSTLYYIKIDSPSLTIFSDIANDKTVEISYNIKGRTYFATLHFAPKIDGAYIKYNGETYKINEFDIPNIMGNYMAFGRRFNGFVRREIPWPATVPDPQFLHEYGDPDNNPITGAKFYFSYVYKVYSDIDKSNLQHYLDSGGYTEVFPKGGSKGFNIYRISISEWNRRYNSPEWQVQYIDNISR